MVDARTLLAFINKIQNLGSKMDDKKLKMLIKKAGKKVGKKLTDDELERAVHETKKVLKGGSPMKIISKMMEYGVTEKQLKDIKRKFEKEFD
jgi:tRNA nucleotidyltransferase/poly(A) polymerase